jgi:ribosome-binding ATPase YchF (GTP1/OBG family)
MTDAIVHVVRCFVDDDIIHVDGTVDPLRDIEVIGLELIFADIAQIEKRLEKVSLFILFIHTSMKISKNENQNH